MRAGHPTSGNGVLDQEREVTNIEGAGSVDRRRAGATTAQVSPTVEVGTGGCAPFEQSQRDERNRIVFLMRTLARDGIRHGEEYRVGIVVMRRLRRTRALVGRFIRNRIVVMMPVRVVVIVVVVRAPMIVVVSAKHDTCVEMRSEVVVGRFALVVEMVKDRRLSDQQARDQHQRQDLPSHGFSFVGCRDYSTPTDNRRQAVGDPNAGSHRRIAFEPTRRRDAGQAGGRFSLLSRLVLVLSPGWPDF
jgi:hypothetical protein